MSWVEVDGAGLSWVEVDGAGWRWVHDLVIPKLKHDVMLHANIAECCQMLVTVNLIDTIGLVGENG